MRLIKYDEEGNRLSDDRDRNITEEYRLTASESRAKRDLTFARGNSDRILKCGARKLQSNLIMELNKKGHSQIALKMSYTYH